MLCTQEASAFAWPAVARMAAVRGAAPRSEHSRKGAVAKGSRALHILLRLSQRNLPGSRSKVQGVDAFHEVAVTGANVDHHRHFAVAPKRVLEYKCELRVAERHVFLFLGQGLNDVPERRQRFVDGHRLCETLLRVVQLRELLGPSQIDEMKFARGFLFGNGIHPWDRQMQGDRGKGTVRGMDGLGSASTTINKGFQCNCCVLDCYSATSVGFTKRCAV